MKALVTGGAGFIGSHIVDYLIRSDKPVRVVDNLVSGSLDNLIQWIDHPLFEFHEIDLLDKEEVNSAVKGCTEVYHLAANPEVNAKNASPEDHFKQNARAQVMQLDMNWLKQTGWSPKFSSVEAFRQTAKAMVRDFV